MYLCSWGIAHVVVGFFTCISHYPEQRGQDLIPIRPTTQQYPTSMRLGLNKNKI